MSGVAPQRMTIALTGLAACGYGFDSLADLAQPSGLALPREPLHTPAAEPTLDSWVITSARGALESAQSAGTPSADRIGLLYLSFWGSIRDTVGYLESLSADGGRYPSPRLFTQSVYSAVASQTVIALGIHGACETLSFVNLPVYRVLQRAWCLLETRRLDLVLAVWADHVDGPAAQLCQRAAAELHHSEFARFRQTGGGSVAVALSRTGNTSAIMHLTLEASPTVLPRDGAATKLRAADNIESSVRNGGRHPNAYPTDMALGFALEILECSATRSPRQWREIDARGRQQTNILLEAAENRR
ncbi:MAG: hypothetical protein ACP5O1_09105 [Phycisphaerae bacterium]